MLRKPLCSEHTNRISHSNPLLFANCPLHRSTCPARSHPETPLQSASKLLNSLNTNKKKRLTHAIKHLFAKLSAVPGARSARFPFHRASRNHFAQTSKTIYFSLSTFTPNSEHVPRARFQAGPIQSTLNPLPPNDPLQTACAVSETASVRN